AALPSSLIFGWFYEHHGPLVAFGWASRPLGPCCHPAADCFNEARRHRRSGDSLTHSGDEGFLIFASR
ncbi:MAG TPA: hypothetical protein PLY87_22615, partial [Planctomycetaceae bacterium]|nr:hypothetical protein [Planctomycetaceae bacterium]